MELSYLIQSPKFSSVWSQSHQRIANNWRFFTFISNGLWACQPEIENGGLDFGLITKSHRCHVIDPLLVSKALCNSSWPCGSKANELFHGRYIPQSTDAISSFRHFHFMRIAIVQSRKEERRNPQVRRCRNLTQITHINEHIWNCGEVVFFHSIADW